MVGIGAQDIEGAAVTLQVVVDEETRFVLAMEILGMTSGPPIETPNCSW